jgi:hypothetical protein
MPCIADVQKQKIIVEVTPWADREDVNNLELQGYFNAPANWFFHVFLLLYSN